MGKYTVTGCVICCLFYGVKVHAQQDPTAPLSWPQQRSSSLHSRSALPQLQSVICEPQCRAILSGQPVAVGSYITGYRVSRINDSSVILTRNKKQWQLSLFSTDIKQ